MSQAANKMYSRAEIRAELRAVMKSKARMRKSLHTKKSWPTPHAMEQSLRYKSQIEGIEQAIRHFGGRS